MTMARQPNNAEFCLRIRTHQIERRQLCEPTEAQWHMEKQIAVQIECLQTTENVALAIIVVPERIQARVGKDGVIQLFELIISGHKPGEIHAFGPAAILGPDAFQVIHVQDFWWNFLETKSRNVEAPTCASCHHPLFQYLGAGMFAFAKVEWVVMVHSELELVVMGKLLQATTR